MLDRLIKDGKTLAVLFCKSHARRSRTSPNNQIKINNIRTYPRSPADDNNDRKSQKVLNELENIDDECDQLGVTFVKIDNVDEAKEYGIDKVPAMLYFEKGIPMVYQGNLEDEEKVLKWLEQQQKADQIEDVTDEMLDIVIEKMPHVAVLFCQ